MPLTICCINRMSVEESCEKFRLLRLLPRKLAKGFVGHLPALLINQFEVNIASTDVRFYLVGVSEENVEPRNLTSLLKKLNPEHIISNEADVKATIIPSGSRTDMLVKDVGGYVALAVLLADAVKGKLQHKIDKGYKPRIFIWGADTAVGKLLVGLLSDQRSSIVISGNNPSAISSLAHSALYETGNSLIVTSTPEKEVLNSDLTLLAYPTPYCNVEVSVGPKSQQSGQEVKPIALNGPPARQVGSGKENNNLNWSFWMIEALYFFLASRGYDGQQERPEVLNYKRMIRVLRSWGFKVVFPENSNIVSICP